MKNPKFETVVKEFCRKAYYKIKNALESNLNRESVLDTIISDDALNEILEKIDFDCKHYRIKLQAKRCLEIIAISLLLNPPNYKSLVNNFRNKTNLSEQRSYGVIRQYIPILGEVIPELDVHQWLPKHHRKPYAYEDIRELARNIGLEKSGVSGTVLTPKDEYEKSIKTQNPAHTHIVITCNIVGHKPWKITPNNLSRGRWCRMCYIENMKLRYKDIQQLAKDIGMEKIGIPGTLLTSKDEFMILTENQKPSHTKLEFSCNIKGHKSWKTTYNHIKNKKWCPECAGGYHEAIARWYLEQIFGIMFPTTRLRDIIPNYSGLMHFDGYAEITLERKKIKTAFEYNGKQHYEFPNQFHKTIKEFMKRLEYDFKKEEIAKNNNIILIIIPYTIIPENMQNYIVKEFESKTEIELPKLPKFNHQNRFVQSTTLNNFL